MQQSYVAIAVFGVVLGIAWIIQRKKKKNNIPTAWKAVGKVQNLCIYPVKSGHRVEVTTVTCTELGPRMCQDGVYQFYDRNLIVYREADNKYITSVSYPKLSLIKAEACSHEDFMLMAPNVPEVVIKIPQIGAKIGDVRVFQDAKVFALDCGDEAAQWISRYIYEQESGLRLGFHDGIHRRNLYETPYFKRYCDIYPILTNAATGMYSYLCSYSLINMSSVNELNRKIADENEYVTAHNFRGNIIIEDFEGRPYVEDNWSWVKIGDVIFYVVKPNTRCSITNINPDTSVLSKKFEPMATLRKDRQLKALTNVDFEGKDPIMGCYMGLHKGGKISVEDIVYISKT